jgi:integrase
MGRAPFVGVHVYDFDSKKPQRPDKPSPWVVRWRVAGARSLGSKSFKHVGDARRFYVQIYKAADEGERFDTETLLPISMLAATSTATVADLAHRFYQKNLDRWLPRSREATAEVLASLLLVATRKNKTPMPASRTKGLTDEQQLRRDIYDWMLSDQNKKKAMPMPSWLAKNTLSLQAMTKDICSDLSTKLNTRLDGIAKAATTQNRIRTNITAMFEYAVEENLLVRNPWPVVKRLTQNEQMPTAQPADEVVRYLPDPDNVKQALNALVTPLSRPGAVARQVLLAIIYYAGLRPSEAAALRIEDCILLPEEGWGKIRVTQSKKATHDKRWMKNSPEVGLTKTGKTRTLLIPQELVEIIRNHIDGRSDGLVAPDERGGMMHTGNLGAAWRRVRQNETWRPYDLRAARASLHVNAGRPRSEVAREMGHSPAVLDKYYLGVSEDGAQMGLSDVEEHLAVKKASPKKKAVPKKKPAVKKAATKKTTAKKKPAVKKKAAPKRASK